MVKTDTAEKYIPEHRLGWVEANLSIYDKLAIESSFASLAYEDVDNRWMKASKMNLFDGYELLQSPGLFTKRRYLFNKIEGISFFLNRTNTPIYSVAKKARFLSPNDVKNFSENELNEICIKYIHFFFGHVEGRHGPFLICENLDDLLYYIREHYEQNESKDELNKFNSLSLKQKHELGVNAKQALKLLYANETTRNFEIQRKTEIKMEDSVFSIIYETYMLFRGSLFKADLIIETNLENDTYALVSLTNENLIMPDFSNNRGETENNPYKEVNDKFQELGFLSCLPPLHLLKFA